MMMMKKKKNILQLIIFTSFHYIYYNPGLDTQQIPPKWKEKKTRKERKKERDKSFVKA